MLETLPNMTPQVYKNWESSFAILSEIFRNIGMAVVAVFVITLVMLSDLRLCLMVLTSIILTLVSSFQLAVHVILLYRAVA